MMNILVACEESQAVTIELRRLGHEAYSCDIIPCSGGHPEWHIMQDVLPLLNGNCEFTTTEGVAHKQVGKWDMLIAFPPCTHLAVSGAKWFPEKQKDFRQQKAVAFFMQMVLANCDKVAVENPVGIMSTVYKKPTQIIQPYMFGDLFEKKTCLWLKGLHVLNPTDIVAPPPRQVLPSGKTMPVWYSNCGGNRAKARSKTFPGIARAMAEQWAGRA